MSVAHEQAEAVFLGSALGERNNAQEEREALCVDTIAPLSLSSVFCES